MHKASITSHKYKEILHKVILSWHTAGATEHKVNSLAHKVKVVFHKVGKAWHKVDCSVLTAAYSDLIIKKWSIEV